MTPFHVGMKVVCVDDDLKRYIGNKFPYSPTLDGLSAGTVYTIRWLGKSSDISMPDIPSCRLVEIVRENSPRSGVEATFVLARFRPAHENRMDELRTLLAPVPSKERELVQS